MEGMRGKEMWRGNCREKGCRDRTVGKKCIEGTVGRGMWGWESLSEKGCREGIVGKGMQGGNCEKRDVGQGIVGKGMRRGECRKRDAGKGKGMWGRGLWEKGCGAGDCGRRDARQGIVGKGVQVGKRGGDEESGGGD